MENIMKVINENVLNELTDEILTTSTTTTKTPPSGHIKKLEFIEKSAATTEMAISFLTVFAIFFIAFV